MDWIDINIKKPEIGLEVEVMTIYNFESTGIWTCKDWIDSNGELKGESSEAPKWRYIVTH